MQQKLIDQIDRHFKEELLEGSRLSSYVDEGRYQLLFLRGIAPKKDDIDYQLHCMLFKDQEIFQYQSKIQDFAKINSVQSIFRILNQLIRNNRVVIHAFSGEIENLEDSLYNRTFPQHFIDIWFDLRDELSKIDRYNLRLTEVIYDFHNSKKHLDVIRESQYHELISSIQFTQSMIKDELSRLDTLHHYYLSIKGDKLNRSLYILTLLSGLFLPLNLIVGFFGMNTENLFFKDQPNGTFYVVYILAGSIAVLLFFIPVFKLLDRLLLRYILGRISLYKKLNEKFDKISDTFKVE